VLTNYNLKHQPERSEDKETFVDSVHRRNRATKLLKGYGIKEKKDINDVITVLQRVLSDHENAGNVVSVVIISRYAATAILKDITGRRILINNGSIKRRH